MSMKMNEHDRIRELKEIFSWNKNSIVFLFMIAEKSKTLNGWVKLNKLLGVADTGRLYRYRLMYLKLGLIESKRGKNYFEVRLTKLGHELVRLMHVMIKNYRDKTGKEPEQYIKF